MATLSIANEFSATPGGRYRSHGRFSGEEFRQDYLTPAWHRAAAHREPLIVVLDGVVGMPSSFLEEAFGGFVRENRNINFDNLRVHATDLTLIPYVRLAERFMREAKTH